MRKTRIRQMLQQDRKDFAGVDPVEAVLFLSSKYTLLPELFDIFGKDVVIEFLLRFGGKTLRIPTLDILEESIRQLYIWKTCGKNPSSETIKSLSVKYSMKESEVKAAASRVEGVLHEQSERFTPSRSFSRTSGTDSPAAGSSSVPSATEAAEHTSSKCSSRGTSR